MKGDGKVIQHLNRLLAGELAAIDQYFIHSRMYQEWGFSKLHAHVEHEMQEEQTHASSLIQRILFLEGTPDVVTRAPVNVGRDVEQMLRNDLAVEYRVIDDLKEVMAYCESARDYETRDILQVLLKDTEEDHTRWLEIQLGLIEKIGLPNYLQSQM
ncbi:bacterioferritin [Methylogaea oryzae]|uniref:Bacterioferritin n=1 Tax=Methylogaea oryzae TaxID=1295382 RepID=A0A8D4VU26_9GAMM|nr:bacterioferritin [Methylogaea oryzae]BBL72295.1 bacterioferritin [Methylogaea oryzae]